MRLHRIADLAADDVLGATYDVALFGSGYEERATHVPRLLDKTKIGTSIVLGFREIASNPQRVQNREYFGSEWGGERPSIGSDEDDPIYEVLRSALTDVTGEVRLLVDYSSMSRVWYAAVLNWARYARRPSGLVMDFVYSVGDHRERVLPRVTGDVVPIPGCEGTGTQLSRAIGVFGLGFDGLAILSVLDMLEPDVTYGYLAAPAAFPDYPARARMENEEFISKHARETLELPLQSVERTFWHLAELVAPHIEEDDVSVIPMGPKPHVLAAILLAMRFERISCLRIGTRRQRPEDVGTTGEIVATRIEFKPEGVATG